MNVLLIQEILDENFSFKRKNFNLDVICVRSTMNDFSIQSHNSDCIQLQSLVSWTKSLDERGSDVEIQSPESKRFSINSSLNSKIYLWKGDIVST